MESDKDRIERLEEAYRKLWAENEDLKSRIKENYAEFKSLRDHFGVKPQAQQVVSSASLPKPILTSEESKVVQSVERKSMSSVSKPEKSSTDWEKFIGEQLLSKIGIMVLLVGLIIGTKYAIDHNWLSIGVRIMGTYAIAAILGFFAYRFKEKYRSFSAVLAAGAVSISYFITYAAFSWYHVIPFGISFAGLLVCVIAAVYLAWYYDLVIIAHLGLIAAYVLPPLISTSNNHMSYYLAYMLVINLGMLAISLLKNWRSIRVPILVWSNLVFLAWFFFSYHEKTDWLVASVYCLLYFLSFHIGAVLPALLRKEKLQVISFGEVIPVTLTSYGILRYILWAADSSLTTLILFAVLVCAYFAYWVYEGIKREDSVLKEMHLILISGIVIVTICMDASIHFQSIYMLLLVGVFYYVLTKYKKDSYDNFVLLGLIFSFGMFIIRQLSTASIIAYYPIILWTGILFCLIILALCFWNYKYVEEKGKYSSQQVLPYFAFGTLFVTIANQVHARFVFEKIDLLASKIDLKGWYHNEMVSSKTAVDIAVMMFLFIAFMMIRRILLRSSIPAGLAMAFSFTTLFALLIFSILSYSSINYYVSNPYYFGTYNLGRYLTFIGILIVYYMLFKQKEIPKNTVVWFSLSLLWILSLELAQWSIYSGFGAGYKIVLTLLWVTFSIGMIVRGLMTNAVLLRSTAMGILGISMIKLFFYDLIHLSTITKVVVFMLVGGLLLVGAYFYQRIAKVEQAADTETKD